MQHLRDKKLVGGIVGLVAVAGLMFMWPFGSSADEVDGQEITEQSDEFGFVDEQGSDEGGAQVVGGGRDFGGGGDSESDPAAPETDDDESDGADSPATPPEDQGDSDGGSDPVHPNFPCKFCGPDGPVVVDPTYPLPPQPPEPPPEPPEATCKPVDGGVCQ